MYRIRVVFQGGTIHLVSSTEPEPSGALDSPRFKWTPIDGEGDVLGFIDWSAVVAVSWRRCEEIEATESEEPEQLVCDGWEWLSSGYRCTYVCQHRGEPYLPAHVRPCGVMG
jgi:hypothetical protein